jgi:ABC-type molybdate transport system permease subunit
LHRYYYWLRWTQHLPVGLYHALILENQAAAVTAALLAIEISMLVLVLVDAKLVSAREIVLVELQSSAP